MAVRVIASGAIVLHTEQGNVRVISSGAIVLHTTVNVETITASDSLNNWLDSLETSVLVIEGLAVSDSLNNWADTVEVDLLSLLSVSAADSLNNWADAIAQGFTAYSPEFSDSLNNWADSVELSSDLRLIIADSFPGLADSALVVFPRTG